MEVDSCRRIRQHFYATTHFEEACTTAYNEILRHGGGAPGVGLYELHAAVVKVHEILGGSLRGYWRRAPYPPSPSRVYLAFLGRLVGDETALSEAEFVEFALDVIVEEVWSYMKWDLRNRIYPMAVMIATADADAAAVGDDGRRAYLAWMFAGYCACMAAITLIAVRFRDRFFREHFDEIF